MQCVNLHWKNGQIFVGSVRNALYTAGVSTASLCISKEYMLMRRRVQLATWGMAAAKALCKAMRAYALFLYVMLT